MRDASAVERNTDAVCEARGERRKARRLRRKSAELQQQVQYLELQYRELMAKFDPDLLKPNRG